MKVASLENCKRLYELSGWDNSMLWYYQDYSQVLVLAAKLIHEGDFIPSHKICPAYDLGYLLRKLPAKIDDDRYSDERGSLGLWPVGDKWSLGYTDYEGLVTDETGETLDITSDTPEDAACLLAIKLFEENILRQTGDKP